MPGTFYPRHALHLAAVLEDFSGASTALARAVEWDVVPRSARLERNDIHTADRLTFTLDFREFPFHPTALRAASVAYFAGATDGGPLARTPATMRFLGVVDVPEMDLGEDAQTVTLECRDYTAVLLGQKATPAMAVPLGRPMDEVLRDLLATLPGELATLLTPTLESPPDVDLTWPIVPAAGRANARLPVEPRDTLWSIIRRLVETAGLVVFVDLDMLVVATSRTLGADGAIRDADRLHMVFGENTLNLRMKRTLHTRTKPVVLRQYDPTTGETTHSEWPPPGARSGSGRGRAGGARGRGAPRPAVVTVVTRGTRGATVADNDDSAEEFVVVGTRTEEELFRAAEALHRRRSMTEMEGSFVTHDPVVAQVRGSRGNAAPPFDLYAIHTATTLFADLADHARVAFDATASSADRRAFLVARGYAPEIADALVRSWDGQSQVALPFIVNKAALTLDGEAGFRAEVDFGAMLTPLLAGEVATAAVAPAPPTRAAARAR